MVDARWGSVFVACSTGRTGGGPAKSALTLGALGLAALVGCSRPGLDADGRDASPAATTTSSKGPLEAGTSIEAAVPLEAGTPIDAAVPIDAGASLDAASLDAGATSDTGASLDAGATPSASKRAEDCLAHPTCAAAEAARLFVAASDAADPDLDCFRFLDGAGAPRDLARARACFEGEAKALACDGSSLSLDAATLALMRIDAIGGHADARGGRALLDGCFDDVTRQALVEHAAAKDEDAATPSVDFCKDIGGTTITSDACEARGRNNADTARDLQAKAVVASLDEEGRALFAASDHAFSEYVTAMGAFVYEVYVQGTIRNAMSLATETKLAASRQNDLEAFPRFVAKATTSEDVAAAQRASAAAFARVGTTTPAERAALEKTQRAWKTYEDADVALYEHVFAPKQGADRVEAALRVRLESRRAKECAPPSASGE